MTTFNDIIATVADYRDLNALDILSPTRVQPIAHARQEVAYFARSELGHSYAGIARRMSRDHGTIMYGVRAVINRMGREEYAADIDAMTETLDPSPTPIFKSRRLNK